MFTTLSKTNSTKTILSINWKQYTIIQGIRTQASLAVIYTIIQGIRTQASLAVIYTIIQGIRTQASLAVIFGKW